nr:PREDICTED: LOW QUALITY PROTEIN: GON-4-like protein [Anolis carolinensis]|eukprot:XP_008119257.1 PREDICTED: LOW QUALITY PROTEIN: GON-4-like protein [Anolis carolinensis]
MDQESGPEMAEVLPGNEKMGSDLCEQEAEVHRDRKASSSIEPLGDNKEETPGCEAGSVLMEIEGEVGDHSPDGKGPKSVQSVEPFQEVKEEAEEMGLIIPLEEREEGGKRKKRKATKRKREGKIPEENEGGPLDCDLKLDDTLDKTLEDGAKQHNLTAVNVRNILHEVITNEHVVAMMKAAISETEDIPMFEPKMTRSKLKEVVEKGVVIPTWNISPIKKANEMKQPPQFVDIPLEEDDDSSDEEYQPEEEEEDETAEESLLESDVESTSSSPRGAKKSRTRLSSDIIETDEEGPAPLEAEKEGAPPLQRHISAEVVPMGPPPPPKPRQSKDSTFMEKLHAVDEELASSPMCIDSYQPLEDSLIAFRTRSKRPLKDVPLGQLEAELHAPDITPDMYDPNTADDEEWKQWLGSLMTDDMENEDEADDDDDPEYNFLEDMDEPDTEDFRNDRAVRITKKEVNELMEELFETFQDEMGLSNVEDEGLEDEDSAAEARPNFNTPQVLRFEEPLANLLNEQHRTVKEQLEQLRMKKSAAKTPQEAEKAKLRSEKPLQALALDAGQRKRLQQQMQQHVQLLMQIYLLSSANPSLSSEANTTRLLLTELDSFAQSSTFLAQPLGHKFQTAFQPCNLREALQLITDFQSDVNIDWSPRKAIKKNVNDFVPLPKPIAWILATRRVFMHPELLPTCSLKAKTPRDKIVFTKGEDNLLALGLKHFEGTEFPKPLISKYLLTTKTAHQLTVRIKNLNMNRVPDNILRYYKTTKQLPVLSRLCEEVQPHDRKPPLEHDEHHLPFWLKASLPSIQEELEKMSREASVPGSELAGPGQGHKYPLRMPEGVQWMLRPLNSCLFRKTWRRQRPAAAKPLPVRTGLCSPPAGGNNNFFKMAARHPQPEAPPSKGSGRVPRLIQPAPFLQPLPVNLQPAPGNGANFELQGLLPTRHPNLGAQNVIPALPVAFQPKMMLPVLRVRKPGPTRGYQKKKAPLRAAPLLKPAPLLQPTPVIFTVPTAAVNGWDRQWLQCVGRDPGRGSPQPIPITTLLVNPSPFPCPLNQPLAVPSAPPLVVTSPMASTAVTVANVMAPGAGPNQAESQEPSPCAAVSSKEHDALWSSDANTVAPVETSVEMMEENAGPIEKIQDDSSEAEPLPETPSSVGPLLNEDVVLGLGQELDIEPPPRPAEEPKESPRKQGSSEEGKGDLGASTERTPSPCKDTSSAPESVSSQPKPEGGPSLPVSQEAGGEKDGPEEEEEEDFDDYIHDEEDEEMSSASEESVLSVPELQETMEKLTWLASERRLSQEGDSEEENSQEENSEPEEEEEEEEEGENLESLQKEDEMTDEVADPADRPALSLTLTCTVPEVEPRRSPPGENAKAPGKSRNSYRTRAKRGRSRASKDTSKLLLLYDEDILERDPLREQKDLAFAQAYLSRVREALRSVPGKYEEFLRIIYEFESNAQKQTAVDLYAQLRSVLQGCPQLLTDFAAFLLPEQALECGLFEEQQAFEKSRKFLRQLEICFAENPSHHQKIIKVLQSCAECLPQEIVELKTQMWQLLKGHDHLQDEFSVFFDHLRPSASRLGDFEEINWTEEKEYEFDGFEEVSLPEVEEEEEPPKMHTASKNKRRKELGGQNTDKELEWAEGAKECFCSCHEATGDLRMKRSKRRSCSHCSNKAAEGKLFKQKDTQELADGLGPQEASLCPEGKDPVEERLELREDGELPLNRMRSAARRADPSGAGPRMEGKPPSCKDVPSEAKTPSEPCSVPDPPAATLATSAFSPKAPQPRSSPTGVGSEVGVALRSDEASSVLCRDISEPATHGATSPQNNKRTESDPVPSSRVLLRDTEMENRPSSPETRALRSKDTNGGLQAQAGGSTEGLGASGCSLELLPTAGGREGSVMLQRAAEATVCAKNIKVSSTGEKVVLWTREADRVILTTCQERGATPDTFGAISQRLCNKTADEVSHRFRELMALFHTACDVSSEDEDDGLSISHTDQLSDKDPVLSEEEQEEPGFG